MSQSVQTTISCNDPELKREAKILVMLKNKRSFSDLVWSLMADEVAKNKDAIEKIKGMER